MNQEKIGRFIAQRRKEQQLTQATLAEMLNVTDRAISKWETGKGMPDSSIMLPLCEVLQITVNELLCGEMIVMSDNNKKEFDSALLELVKQKEKADKQLLSLEIVIGILAMIILLSSIFMASLLTMPDWLRIVLIIGGFVPFAVGIGFAIRIEQTAGYYECRRCQHRYVPTYTSVLWAMHVNRTRYMKCPHCQKRSWHRKVISKQ